MLIKLFESCLSRMHADTHQTVRQRSGWSTACLGLTAAAESWWTHKGVAVCSWYTGRVHEEFIRSSAATVFGRFRHFRLVFDWFSGCFSGMLYFLCCIFISMRRYICTEVVLTFRKWHAGSGVDHLTTSLTQVMSQQVSPHAAIMNLLTINPHDIHNCVNWINPDSPAPHSTGESYRCPCARERACEADGSAHSATQTGGNQVKSQGTEINCNHFLEINRNK